MARLILFDADVRQNLLPLTYSRPVGDLRIGLLTVREKWERHLGLSGSFLTQDYLEALFPLAYDDHNLLINGNILPTAGIVALVLDLLPGEAYLKNGELVAACLDRAAVEALAQDQDFGEVQAFDLGDQPLLTIREPADIFTQNALAIREDYVLLTAGQTSAPLSATNVLIGPAENLFLEEGVKLEASFLNVEDGPIYISQGAIVLEGSMLRGPLGIGAGTLVKMGAKIYGGTTLGPHCRAGGEINNVVMQGNSNKGHDGFLGNAVIGEWCNLGADTNASNLRNDYGDVKVWSYPAKGMVNTGRQFHGLVMGDHAKSGINTMFNTGTVVGFAANVFGAGFPPAFIPSFSWGGAAGLETYRLDKAMETAERVMARRETAFTEAHRAMFSAVFAESAEFRGEGGV